MNDIVEDLIKIENSLLAGILFQALKKENPKEEFLRAVKENEENWIYGWDQWRSDAVYEEVLVWLDDLPINIREDWQEFWESNCDCPICKTMAEGRDDPESLKDAFRKANFKQVIDNIEKGEDKE